jgi:1-deoxy-D-xylulose-5-phosphate synthase
MGLPLVVILNDNKMSISPNVGGLSKYLSRLSMKARYQTFRRHFDAMIKKLPFIGGAFFELVVRLKRAVRAVFYTDNFFVDLGCEYVGPIEGHHIQGLISVLEDVRRLDHPVVLHVITRKGKGYSYAEDDPGSYHGVGAFSVSGGIARPGGGEIARADKAGISFTEAFGAAILAVAERDARVAALTAAMEKGTGLSSFRKLFVNRFFDVGIAEEHAITFAAGLAARGMKPVAAVYSTFIQRAADQIIHDAALQKLPITLALDRSGFVGDDGETHQGLFDIALFRAVPNTAILAPASESELRLMLEWALEDRQPAAAARDLTGIVGFKEVPAGPVIIRYPKARCPAEIPAFSLPLELGRGVFVSGPREDQDAGQVCLAFTGSLYAEVLDAAARLAALGIKADLYNIRFLKPVDEDYLQSLMDRYELMIFVEEGIAAGGFGEYAMSLAGRQGRAAAALAVQEHFVSLGTRKELLRMNGLDGKGIAIRVREMLFPYPDSLEVSYHPDRGQGKA